MRRNAAPPDIVLIGASWPARALVRAQLIAEGYEVVATDAWPIPRQFLRPGMRPRLLIVDLQNLVGPDRALDELKTLLKPERVLVVTALGTLTADEVRAHGFHVISRPLSVDEIVHAAARLLPR